ncbi:MAG TPA: ferredoxin [Pirellulaceae bacterium]|nr:ferredoxin [Pirellulaceae bacterium]
MPIVKFVKEKKEIEVPEGANLRAEAVKAGINLNQGLNGCGACLNKYLNCSTMSLGLVGGMCGTCRVLITKGMENCNPMTFRERLKFKAVITPDPIPALAFVGHEDTMRLACCVKVNGDIEVESGPEVNLFGENFFS